MARRVAVEVLVKGQCPTCGHPAKYWETQKLMSGSVIMAGGRVTLKGPGGVVREARVSRCQWGPRGLMRIEVDDPASEPTID